MKRFLVAMVFVLLWTGIAVAAHPLSTDDTGTQGKGKFQLELTGELIYDSHSADGGTIKTRNKQAALTLTAGIIDNVDIVLGLPLQWNKTITDEGTTKASGIADMPIAIKWRFFETKEGLSLAIMPKITIPTGNADKDLGNGRPSYGATLIATKEIEGCAFHFNVGYTYNDYKLQEAKDANRRDIWRASLAGEFKLIKDLKAVAGLDIEQNSEKGSNTHPVTATGGVIYSIAENIDVDLGLRVGLNRVADDIAGLAGLTFKF